MSIFRSLGFLCAGLGMRTLRTGMNGQDVQRWQLFLAGQGYDIGEADGDFGPKTKRATEYFQRDRNLTPDGVAGRETLIRAMAMGFGDFEDEHDEETSSLWPPKPAFGPLVSTADRQRVFGAFAYKATPTPGNPEGITITDNWAKDNMILVDVPQLKGVPGSSGKVYFHKLAAQQLVDLFAAWEAEGLLPLVLSWAGSWVPRFIRGSRTVLSNHAFGTAFDINVPQNMLGAQPALVGQKGSVRKLAPIAAEHGFYWGGWFDGRPDGMHFEVAFLK